jgi:carbon starvation protein
VDGVLAALFAVLVIVVIANAALVCVRALRSGTTPPTTEAPYVESQLVAPAGLIPTAEERREAERRELALAGPPAPGA